MAMLHLACTLINFKATGLFGQALNGTWEQINAALRTDLRVAYGKKSELSAAILIANS